MLLIAMTLLDNEVSFCATYNPKLAENISLLTHSPEVKAEEADFIFITEPEDIKKTIMQAKCGTLADPQRSATFIIKCCETSVENLELYGAGINGTVNIPVPNEVITAINARDEQHYEYPQGVDFIFISGRGSIVCIPRLTLRREH